MRYDGVKHRKIAEKALGGKLPRRAVVHHHDNDGHNNSNTNLVICQDQEYHKLLHRRTEALRLRLDETVTLKIHAEMAHSIAALSESKGTSVAAIIRMAVRAFLDRGKNGK